jgi:hypothetical protein
MKCCFHDINTVSTRLCAYPFDLTLLFTGHSNQPRIKASVVNSVASQLTSTSFQHVTKSVSVLKGHPSLRVSGFPGQLSQLFDIP